MNSLMTKTRKVFFLFLIPFCFSISAKAEPNTHSLGLNAGQVLLLGEFADRFPDAMGFNLIYNYEASDLFGVWVNAGFSNHENSATHDNLAIKSLVPDLKINLAYIDKLVIYSLVGFGLWKVDQTINLIGANVTTFGFNMGGGFALQLHEHFQFGTHLLFNNIFSKTDPGSARGNQAAQVVGGSYMGLYLNAMYTF
jgi:hypothetical protein